MLETSKEGVLSIAEKQTTPKIYWLKPTINTVSHSDYGSGWKRHWSCTPPYCGFFPLALPFPKSLSTQGLFPNPIKPEPKCLLHLLEGTPLPWPLWFPYPEAECKMPGTSSKMVAPRMPYLNANKNWLQGAAIFLMTDNRWLRGDAGCSIAAEVAAPELESLKKGWEQVGISRLSYLQAKTGPEKDWGIARNILDNGCPQGANGRSYLPHHHRPTCKDCTQMSIAALFVIAQNRK